MSESHPIRPGIPTFGRIQGVSGEGLGVKASMLYRPSEARHAEDQKRMDIVNRVSGGFFMEQPKVKPKPIVSSKDLDLSLVDRGDYKMSSADKNMLNSIENQERLGNTPDYVRHGRYLDISV